MIKDMEARDVFDDLVSSMVGTKQMAPVIGTNPLKEFTL
jgi:hypothetical protein